MSAVSDARKTLAQAITATGKIECTAYPPDSLAPPAAFVDNVSIDFAGGAGWSFCYSGMATAGITTVAQRNDRTGATQFLEDLMTDIFRELDEIDGLRITTVDSGTASIGGADLPAVLYTVEFGISSE